MIVCFSRRIKIKECSKNKTDTLIKIDFKLFLTAINLPPSSFDYELVFLILSYR